MKTKKTNILELLQREEKFWVYIKSKQRCKFLKFAKSHGFKWFTGREISLNDDCWLVVAMFADKTMANIPAMHRAFGDDKDSVYKVDFCRVVKSNYHSEVINHKSPPNNC